MKYTYILLLILISHKCVSQCSMGVGNQDFWNTDNECAWGVITLDGSYYNECIGGDGYQLVLDENFNGNSVNTNVWRTVLYGAAHALSANLHSSGASEHQYYSPNNLEVSNGTLKIISKTEFVNDALLEDGIDENHVWGDGITNRRDFYYTSGSLHSYQKFPAGKYEIRCKMPDNESLWPAFWLHWTNGSHSQEIDIPDYDRNNSVNDDLVFRCNIGRDGCGVTRALNCNNTDLRENWHTISAEWDKYTVIYRVDDQIVAQLDHFFTMTGQLVAPCNTSYATANYINFNIMPVFTNMNVLVNVAVRFTDMNIYGDDPATMEIDYIKGWVKLDCSEDVDICNWNPNRSGPTFNDNKEDPTVYTGSRVTAAGNASNCVVNVLSGEFLNIYASDQVFLKDGFKAVAGSTFTAKITPCEELEPLSKTDETVSRNPFLPNKESDIFSIYDSKLIGVYDMLGRKVIDKHEANDNSSLRLLHNGMYIFVYQKEDGTLFSKKIFKPEN